MLCCLWHHLNTFYLFYIALCPALFAEWRNYSLLCVIFIRALPRLLNCAFCVTVLCFLTLGQGRIQDGFLEEAHIHFRAPLSSYPHSPPSILATWWKKMEPQRGETFSQKGFQLTPYKKDRKEWAVSRSEGAGWMRQVMFQRDKGREKIILYIGV